ncbi:IS4/Tn5 family transposase DNA-binding protein [Sphingobium cloacae]|uniref:Transposase n=1 Tax=Sphingobium cloacae TaxID=120107 RepID=A0A1E1F918_9SPHN|nr:transposase DNA-binding-containing protein [Sphingobium cloacae]BAV66911.1 transposase [Sphingobium cloacae]
MDPMLDGASWLDAELAACEFADARLGKRLRRLLEQLGGAIGASLPLACQDWAATKAAYRFLDNDRVSEHAILAGHFAATRSRLAAVNGLILILHDTTEFTFQRQHTEAVGVTYRVNSGKDKQGRWRQHTVCGLLMHSSLAVTLEGLRRGQVLEPQGVSRHPGAQALYQRHACADRAEGKRALAREHASGVSASR